MAGVLTALLAQLRAYVFSFGFPSLALRKRVAHTRRLRHWIPRAMADRLSCIDDHEGNEKDDEGSGEERGRGREARQEGEEREREGEREKGNVAKRERERERGRGDRGEGSGERARIE